MVRSGILGVWQWIRSKFAWQWSVFPRFFLVFHQLTAGSVSLLGSRPSYYVCRPGQSPNHSLAPRKSGDVSRRWRVFIPELSIYLSIWIHLIICIILYSYVLHLKPGVSTSLAADHPRLGEDSRMVTIRVTMIGVIRHVKSLINGGL